MKFWKPNWVGVPKDEQRKIKNELVKKEDWIIDENYGVTMEIRLNAADTIIFLDIQRTTCLYRAFTRMLKYRNRTRPDMGVGCEERFDPDFLRWIWNYPKTIRPEILKRLEQLPKEKQVIILKPPKDVEQFIEKV
ncbi:topology modulation protein [Virgibacillus halodenitrificans]|uniref:Topology modulation protein n=1 Tax=Virgibacillus halodenitrificans TaxID=1482 RepID=A0AAC9IWV9_VIRHA|nr:topology modulation protein [Virgibacillus halodenitrificans]APC46848.1 topology modulation protein [Virgibacillus halodenitrificans]